MKGIAVPLMSAMVAYIGLALLCVGNVRADEAPGRSQATASVSVGVGRNDNVFRSSNDLQSATILSAGVQARGSLITSRFTGDMTSDLNFVDYRGVDLNSEVVGILAAQGALSLIPEHLEWTFRDNFGQASRNQAEALSPQNRENVNYITTGPRLSLRISGANQVSLEGTYSKVDYQRSPIDNIRYGGSLSFAHELSPVTIASLNFHTEKIKYEDRGSDQSPRRYEGFLRYSAKGSRTTLAADAGLGNANNMGRSESKPIFRISASRRISTSSDLDLSLGREFSDAGNLFRQIQGAGVGTGDGVGIQPSIELFVSSYAKLGWQFARGRTGLGVSLSRFTETYEQRSDLNQARTRLLVYFNRALTPTIQLYGSANWTRNSYDVDGLDSTDTGAALGITQKVGRMLLFDLQYIRYERPNGAGLVNGRVNQVWARVYYGFSQGGGAPSIAK